MSGSQREYSSIVDKAIQCLRQKRDRGEADPTVSVEDMIKSLSNEDNNAIFVKYTLPSLLRENYYHKELENNPKVMYDKNTKSFSFRHRFKDIKDLDRRLYAEKIGVIEDQDLYDDIDKGKLEALKSENLFRVITIQEKKSKPAISYLFSKNLDDDVEKLRYDEGTPNILKSAWEKIDKDDLERRINTKRSVQAVLNRDPEYARQLRSTKRKKKVKDEDNILKWHNQHILNKIEEALKLITKKPQESLKPASSRGRKPTTK